MVLVAGIGFIAMSHIIMNEEYNNATLLNRYTVDLVRVGEQQNEEQDQVNGRFAYFFGEGSKDCLTSWGSRPDCAL